MQDNQGASSGEDRAFVPAGSDPTVPTVPASIPDAEKRPDMDWHIFGDWRDLRQAIERASPLWMEASEVERSKLWDFAQSVIAEYAPMKARCLECKAIIPARESYRCTECRAHLCETCIYPHFGQSIWRHR